MTIRTPLPYLQAVRLAFRDLSIRVKDLRILHNKKHTEKSSVVKENLLLLQRKDLGSQHPQLTIISNSSSKGSNILFWSLQAPCTHSMYIQTCVCMRVCAHARTHKNSIFKNFFTQELEMKSNTLHMLVKHTLALRDIFKQGNIETDTAPLEALWDCSLNDKYSPLPATYIGNVYRFTHRCTPHACSLHSQMPSST